MYIEDMYESLEKLASCVKNKFCEEGIDNIDADEMGKAIDMVKDLSEAIYYSTITEAMGESEYGEDYDVNGPRYYSASAHPRSARTGRFVRKYTEPRMMRNYEFGDEQRIEEGIKQGMYREYTMTPAMYRSYDPMYLRDMDRENGKMYYGMTTTNDIRTGNMPNTMMVRDAREGRSGINRMTYMESKAMHNDNTAESNTKNMRELEKYINSLKDDFMEMLESASPSEKQVFKQKMQNAVNALPN